MKLIAPADRPREKLLQSGVGTLGDNELLAIVLGSGSREMGALDLANALLGRLRGIKGMATVSIDEMMGVKGIGPAKACQLAAVFEIGRRLAARHAPARVRLLQPRDTAALLMPQYGSRLVEHFGVILLDVKGRVRKISVISVGTREASLVHPREIFREATVGGASAVVLFHNHPSGDPTPSPEDFELTARLTQAGELMGIPVVDHVIVADGRYVSFKEAGQL